MKKRKYFPLLLILLYGIALLKPAFPIIEYAFKLDVYLAQCVNKGRPEMQCNGQCVLMRKLRAADVETSTPTPPAPVKVNLQDYPIGFIEHVHMPGLSAVFHRNSPLHAAGTPHPCYASEIFHPPLTSV